MSVQEFHCHTGYPLAECQKDILHLKSILTRYPIEALGHWTWVLVRSQDWKPISRTLRLNPDSPAFTFTVANREVNLTKRIATPKGLRFCRAALSNNGRVKPDVVLVNDREEKHPEGNYYIEWYEGTKRRRLSVGKNAADAHARRLAKEAELNARSHGVEIAAAKLASPTVASAIVDYLAEIKITQTPATLSAYTLALHNFTA